MLLIVAGVRAFSNEMVVVGAVPSLREEESGARSRARQIRLDHPRPRRSVARLDHRRGAFTGQDYQPASASGVTGPATPFPLHSPSAMAWDERMKDFRARREQARAMGGAERLARRRAEGRLNARERIERLLDADSFLEVGTFDVSDVPGMEETTPADSKVAGFGKIDGRPVVICSNDFTVLAATSSRVASHKEAELKRLASDRATPIVYLSEAGCAPMPDRMGSTRIVSFGYSMFL